MVQLFAYLLGTIIFSPKRKKIGFGLKLKKTLSEVYSMTYDSKIQSKGLSTTYLTQKVYDHLHPGDIVRIPANLNDGMACFAKVDRIYPRFVLFKNAKGYSITVQYIDAASLSVVAPSDYKKYDELRDLISAFSSLP